MKKRIFSFLMAICMVLSIMPMPAHAEDAPIYYCGEEHTHEDVCLVDPNAAAPVYEEEPQEETLICTCETACAAGAMNSVCAVCSAGGATVEGCGKYVAPMPVKEPQEETPTCTCDTACAARAMNGECVVCGAEGATVEDCGKYVAPAVCTCDTACTAEAMNPECAICGAADAKLENCTKYQAPVSYTVTFDVGEHGTAPEIQTITSGGIVEKPTDPTAEGFTFGGWYVDEAYTTEYDFSTAVTANTTLYAKWTEAVPSHTHSWATNWSTDATHHWHECTAGGCPVTENSGKDGYAVHSYENDCDADCNICGVTREVTHRYENGICTVCQQVETTPAVDSDGDGYVEIDSAAKLWWFTHQVKDGQNNLNAELTANIDLAGTCGDGIGNWLPISHSDGYKGHFNGQGYTVLNLYIASDEQYAGLFGYVKGATIENVTVTGSVSSTFYSTYDENYNFFDGAAGGVVAHLDGGTIRTCESDVTVTGGLNFGGICGQLSSGIIEDCINRGTIIRDLDSMDVVYYGGIVGYMDGGTVRGCINQGADIVGAYAEIGGIVGLLIEGTVEKCINLGNIATTQNTNAGGIAGRIWIYGAIRNCGNLGTVTGDYAGGITGGSEGDIEHCWNIASVSGTSEYVGPIAGLNRDDYGVITNSYYLSDTTTDDGGRTAEQFASGQVAYELNGSTTTENSVWRQTLGTDSYPALSGERVYYGTPYRCDGVLLDAAYSNSPISESIPPHSYDESGLCSVCATQAIASVAIGDEVDFYLSFADALAKAKEGSEASPAVMKLLTDFTVDEAVTMTGGYATLDLNGKTITFTGVSESHYITFDSATVTFEDSSTEGTGKITFDFGNRSQTIYFGVALTNASTLTVNGGTYYVRPCFPFLLLDGSTMEQNGGTITPGVYVDNGKYILNDGYLNGCFYSRTDGNSEEYRTDLVLNGGTMEFSGRFVLQRDYPTFSTITITGGIYNSGDIIRFETPDEMKLSGGTFSNGIILDSYWEDYDTLKEILAPGYAFYDADGNLVALTEDQTEIAEYVTVGVCTHQYVYTAEGNVITESCANLACTHSATAAISMESTDYNYNGMAHPATVTYSDGWKGGELTAIYQGTAVDGSVYAVDGPVSAGLVTASITIQDATASIEYPIAQTIADPGDVFVSAPETVYGSMDIADIVLGRTDTTVPGTLALNAGQVLSIGTHGYQWTFTPEDSDNYRSAYGTVSITVVEDTLQSIAVTTPPEKTTYEHGQYFNESGMVVTATYASGRTEVIDSNDLTITPEELTVRDTYVTITYQGLTTTQEITVNPREVTEPYFKLEFSSYPYTGKEIHPNFRLFVDRTGDIEIPASEYEITYTNNIQLGTATITITDVPGGNYDISGSKTFEITKAPLRDVSVSQNGTLTYTGEAQTPSVNASATTADGAAVTFTYCLAEDGAYTAELPAFTNAGTYTVYYRITAANHEDISDSFEVVVEQARNEYVVEPSIEDWTYGEAPSTPVGQAKFGTVKFYYATYGSYGISDWSETVPTEAGGNYLLGVAVEETQNWEGMIIGSVGTFTIHKATPTADTFDFTPPANLNACDGLAKEATVTVKEGIEGVGSITIKYFKDGNELDSAPTAAGTYTVKIEAAEGANYKAATLTDDAWTFTFDITDAADHTNVTLVPNNDGTHDKVCTVCEKVIESNTTCSGTTTDDCDKGYKCACGNYFGTKEHDFSGDYLTDAEFHWHVCADCGATDTKVKHSATEDGDCTTEEKCACGTVVIEAKNEHSFDNSCDTTCGNPGCTHTREITHTPREDDGDCTTAIHCSVCDALLTAGNPSHEFDNSCDTDCNRTGCNHIRTITHTPNADDGDCTTAILCSICNAVTTEAKDDHGFDNSCDTTCGNPGCTHTREITHTPRDDDGDCTTAIHCAVCDAMTTPGNPSHDFDNACDTDCNRTGCNYTRTTTHVPNEDDGNCETAIHCSICNVIVTPAKSHSFTNTCDTDCNNDGCTHTRTTEHKPEEDDGDCTTDILCSICDAVTTKGNASHTGGTATCTAKAKCEVCFTEYGEMLDHTFTVPQSDDKDHWNKCKDCDAIDLKIKHSGDDDDDCTTAVKCSCGYVLTVAQSHSFDSDCDTDCNNVGCKHTRIISHKPEEDDGSCLTEIRCTICNVIITSARDAHTGGTATCTAKAKCEVCDTEYGEMLEHSFTVPQNDDTDHWNKCKNCDAIDTKVKHSGTDDGDCTTAVTCACGYIIIKAAAGHTGGTSTCTAKAKCEVCDTEYGEMLEHSFTVPQNDDTDHWNKCNDCDAIDTKVKHSGTDDGDCTTAVTCACGYIITEAKETHSGGTATCTARATCEVCDAEYGEVLEHSFTVPQNDDADHWNKCKDCDAIDTKVKHSGTDDGDCTTEVKCSCGYVITKATADHTGGAATCTAKAECEVCGTEYGELLAHTYIVPQSDSTDHWNKCKDCDAIDAKVKHSGTDDGNCLTPVTCSCGHVITEARDAHTGGTTTCTSKAKCTECGEEYGDYGDHKWDTGWTNNSEKHWHKCLNTGCTEVTGDSFHSGGTATCKDKAKCEFCDVAYGDTDGDNHNYSATLTWTDDEHFYECSLCSAKKDKALHDFTDDCDKTCNTCDYERTVSHTFNKLEKDADGHWYICSVCGVEAPEGKDAHSGGTATCTAKAKCNVCGTEYGKLGTHGETEVKDAKDATCTEEGYTGDKHCKVCGELLESGKDVAKTGHTYKNGKCTVCKKADPNYDPDVPQTGDTSHAGLWLLMMLVGGLGLAATIIYGRKRRTY